MKYNRNYKFITVTYNHQLTILRHLNSILIQIELFKPYSVDLLIIDDFSNDGTVALINQWLKLNSNYFNEVDFIVNKNNVGFKNNVIYILKTNKNPHYKLLAGDDAYVGNIFDFMEYSANHDVVFSPLITVVSNKLYFKDYPFKKKLDPSLSIKNIELLKQGVNTFSAPGSYVNPKLCNKKYIEYLVSYLERGHEDYPSWYYLFLVLKVEYSTYNSPICLYFPTHQRYGTFMESVRYLKVNITAFFQTLNVRRGYILTPSNLKYIIKNLNNYSRTTHHSL